MQFNTSVASTRASPRESKGPQPWDFYLSIASRGSASNCRGLGGWQPESLAAGAADRGWGGGVGRGGVGRGGGGGNLFFFLGRNRFLFLGGSVLFTRDDVEIPTLKVYSARSSFLEILEKKQAGGH